MKFDLKNVTEALSDACQLPRDIDPFSKKVANAIKVQEIDVNFEVLQYHQEFGFEYLGS